MRSGPHLSGPYNGHSKLRCKVPCQELNGYQGIMSRTARKRNTCEAEKIRRRKTTKVVNLTVEQPSQRKIAGFSKSAVDDSRESTATEGAGSNKGAATLTSGSSERSLVKRLQELTNTPRELCKRDCGDLAR